MLKFQNIPKFFNSAFKSKTTKNNMKETSKDVDSQTIKTQNIPYTIAGLGWWGLGNKLWSVTQILIVQISINSRKATIFTVLPVLS